MMEKSWVDFRAVKAAVTMQAVLDRYKINWLRKSGGELRGRCPIHEGDGGDAFHVSVTKNAFHCFSCRARGNVLDFVAAMEKCSVRDAAARMQEWFSIDSKSVAADANRPASEKRGEEAQPENKPLAFELKGIDAAHPYLAERRITRQTAEAFGVGMFSGRGSMSGRVVIPIHNERGELVAYAGRSIDGSEPRYKLPSGFHKSHVLFNLHRVTTPEVIVVEGFFDCMTVWQLQNPSVVALMGCTLSDRQEKLLVDRFQKVTLLLDGDDAGMKASEDVARRLIRRVHVRLVEVPDGKQPDQLDAEHIGALLGLQ